MNNEISWHFQSSNDGAVKQELVVKVLVNHGQSLVDSLIQASIFLLPSYMIVDIAGTFFELLTYQKVVSISFYWNIILATYKGINPLHS